MSVNQQKWKLNPMNILLHIPVPWVFVLTYLGGLIFRISGVIIFTLGALFASWSLIIFHKARTTTTPGESSKKIVIYGPYRYTRNPMYVSLILAYLGEAGILGQLWPVIALPLVMAYVNWVVIPLEEEVLRKDFKDEYENYCSRVHRWF